MLSACSIQNKKCWTQEKYTIGASRDLFIHFESGKNFKFQSRLGRCFWVAWGHVPSVSQRQSVHCLMFPGLCLHLLCSRSGPFGWWQKIGPWLMPPFLKGWLCCSHESSSARGKLFNQPQKMVKCRDWRVCSCVGIWFRDFENKCSFHFLLWALFKPVVVASYLVVCSIHHHGEDTPMEAYQLRDVWILRALIDSIYLYTLPL